MKDVEEAGLAESVNVIDIAWVSDSCTKQQRLREGIYRLGGKDANSPIKLAPKATGPKVYRAVQHSDSERSGGSSQEAQLPGRQPEDDDSKDVHATVPKLVEPNDPEAEKFGQSFAHNKGMVDEFKKAIANMEASGDNRENMRYRVRAIQRANIWLSKLPYKLETADQASHHHHDISIVVDSMCFLG